MKVRHKSTGVEFEVKKLLHPQPYYLTKGGSMIHVDDPAFEIVPDEVWEDCTEACRIDTHVAREDGQKTIVHDFDKNIKIDILNPFQFKENYRFRKIDGIHHGSAFIVERRKEST